ncbi:hypothetical protein AAFF_G00362620 [Aldrovandia affinis]|uniref:Cell cycle exit and neuronal differentiation protein 1 n=1 Tax=Aldrovandia affinis TaxID=143900 RepID=A0AAD7SIJ1_9TELE|nr:hypothetical protein AAFF_G00362620 [Aldrovandia affinis]
MVHHLHRTRDPMEAKSKITPGAPRSTSGPRSEKLPERTGKKAAAPPRKTSPIANTPPPAATSTEKTAEDGTVKQGEAVEDVAVNQDEAANHEHPAEGAEAGEAKPDCCLESLKPLLIGGAVIAGAAILMGIFLLARRN